MLLLLDGREGPYLCSLSAASGQHWLKVLSQLLTRGRVMNDWVLSGLVFWAPKQVPHQLSLVC